MDAETPQAQLDNRGLVGLGGRFPWLPWLLGAACLVMIFGFRFWVDSQQKIAVTDCLQVAWGVQKAEYRFFKSRGRYGSRAELVGNKGKKSWLGPNLGWQVDLHCPEFSLKLTRKKKGFLIKARPRGEYGEHCQILADHRGPPRTKGKCG